MRLESTKLAMWFLPLAVVAYAWVCEKHVHVSAICVMLFIAGFFSMFVHTCQFFQMLVIFDASHRSDGYIQALWHIL